MEFQRDGTPGQGFVVGKLKSGERFIANHGDESTLAQLASGVKEQVGRAGWVKAGENGRNLFSFDGGVRL